MTTEKPVPLRKRMPFDTFEDALEWVGSQGVLDATLEKVREVFVKVHASEGHPKIIRCEAFNDVYLGHEEDKENDIEAVPPMTFVDVCVEFEGDKFWRHLLRIGRGERDGED